MSKVPTSKQESAAQRYVENGGNRSEAYRHAYDAENMSEKAMFVEASRLFQNPVVALKVLELQAEHRERHKVTVDTITTELDEAKKLAKDEKQPAAMTGAIMGKAKIHGLVTDKSKIDLSNKDGSLTPVTLDMSKLSTTAIKELLAARPDLEDDSASDS